MVDPERVARLVHRLRGEIAYLHARAIEDRDAIRQDVERLSGLKYRFITALETVIGIAQHLCASEGWGPLSSNASALHALGREGVISADLAERLGRAVGFRNILVHHYAEVDDDRVIANLDDVGDLTAFADAVASWVRA